MKIQDYRDGEIHKVKNSYRFVKKGIVYGYYGSLQELTYAYESNNRQNSGIEVKQKKTKKVKIIE